MKWRKCRDPKDWICDRCGVCGGCDSCEDKSMYHKGKDTCLCEDCYSDFSVLSLLPLLRKLK